MASSMQSARCQQRQKTAAANASRRQSAAWRLRRPALRHLRMGHHLPPLYFPRSPCYARQSKKVSQTPKTFKKSVDKYPTPCYNNICRRLKSQPRQSIWGFSSAGRALAWHARGHRFDPGNLHQKEKHCTGMCSAFLLCLPSYAATKFMLDICGKLWYNSFCNCGYSTSASISAFQAEEVGSIPITRSKRPEP